MTYLEKITQFVNRQAPISEFVKLYKDEFGNKPTIVIVDDYFEQCISTAKNGPIEMDNSEEEEEDDYNDDYEDDDEDF